jgi:tetratricopeptide (TPR) repeat protein
MLSNAGKREEALARFEEAIAIAQKLADAYPTVTDFQDSLAISHDMIGGVLRGTGKLHEALAAHEKCLAIRQKLADAFPKMTNIQNNLAGCHSSVAGDLRALGRLDEARVHYKQSADGLKRLGLAQQASGKTAEAADYFRRAGSVYKEIPARTPQDLYELACCQALLSGLAGAAGSGVTAADGRKAAKQAMDTLRQAVMGGYSNLLEMRTDHSLDPLRQRADFQRLLAEIEEV